MIKTFHITTGMGEYHGTLPFLSDAELEEFNSIGYSGKNLDGEKTTRLDYLNSLMKSMGSYHNSISYNSFISHITKIDY